MINKILVRIILALLLLSGLALGGYDLSGGEDALNMSLLSFNAMGAEGLSDETDLVAGAPQVAATDQGTELAAYTDQAPPASDLGRVMQFDISANYPMYIFYDRGYLGWSNFKATFPSDKPGLWIEKAAGWSWYATLPLGGWSRELLYVPDPSEITLYEIYPAGFVRGYDLGYAEAGYHIIWYYADSPGRHSTILASNSGYSNAVVVDVYSPIIRPKPAPDPRKECEKRSNDRQNCYWSDGACRCVPKPAPNPVAECQARSNDEQNCYWSNGGCHCVPKPAPNPVAECEDRGCQWYDGDCHCDIPGPVPNPVDDCESNPQCDYVNGNCYCRGIDPEPEPEPMPGPVPNPYPDIDPMPGPVPNPYPQPDPFNPSPNPADDCEGNPSCHYSGGRCYCAGFNSEGDLGGYSGGDLEGSEDTWETSDT